MPHFSDLLRTATPLQIVGTINAYSALLAKQAGHRAIYLSGAGVANACFGLPDLAITTMNDVVAEAKKICDRCDLPLLVDIDTGFGGAFNIARTIKEMESAGVSAVHIEDQVSAKRCGHRPNKEMVSQDEMVDRIKSAVDAKNSLYIIARTDALQNETCEQVEERCEAYLAAGADAIFLEAVTDISLYARFSKKLGKPILANITEFGKTPLYPLEQLANQGVAMVLYPLSAFRAMSKAALDIYTTLKEVGTVESKLGAMQTREELYKTLDYYTYEKKLDNLFKKT
ncbi:MAG: methylisocitrate lyase [Methylacidiphilales bacterium]|nr:methylisocitrate lyase [Candidatus Methylacidiphilales bacterium]